MTTLSQREEAPESYPTTSPAITGNDVAWQRIESYIAYRFTPRTVVWVVEGPDEWSPPLAPAAITKIEIWADGGWTDITANAPDASPLGYCLDGWRYRFTAVVGGGSPAPTVPAIVWEAVKRLAAYLSAKAGTPGARSESISAGSIDISRTRSESWMARAMANSGAADLLRNYRRV
jgi:hypothetical protein